MELGELKLQDVKIMDKKNVGWNIQELENDEQK